MVLLAILHLEDDAWGLAVAQEIERRTDREVARGSLYVTFDRLEQKGYLRSKYGDASDERGGRPRRYLAITARGRDAVLRSRAALQGLFRGLDARLGK
jgi:DNA-binding PadR family transcriptional regulator